ncbi:MAG TPA: caspase family protein [Pyrinomonadaceae bacterium]
MPPQTGGARPGSEPAAQPEVVAQNGHRGLVTAVAISPDKSLLASGGEDESVKLWDARGGKLLRSFARHAGDVSFVAFTRDGRTLLSAGGRDNRLNAWDVDSGVLLWRHDCGVAALHPDGKSVACAAVNFSRVDVWDSSVAILNARDGKTLRAIPGDKNNYQITALAFSPDGSLLAASAWPDDEESPHFINVWGARAGRAPLKQINVTAAFGGPKKRMGNPRSTADLITSLAFSPDGKVLALADDRTYMTIDETPGPRYVTYWEPSSGRLLRRFDDSVEGRIVFHPAGASFASGGRQVKLWDARSGALVRTVEGVGCAEPKGAKSRAAGGDGDGECYDNPVTFSADGQLLAAGGRSLSLWEPATGRTTYFRGAALAVNSVGFGRDGKTFATSNAQTTTVWDATGGWPARNLSYKGALGYSADAGRVALLGKDGTKVDVFDTAKGVLVASLPVAFATGLRVSFAGADKLLISGRDGRAVISQVWGLQSGKPLGLLIDSSVPEYHLDDAMLVLSEDGKTFWDGTVVSDATGTKPKRTFETNFSNNTHYIAVSPDGKVVVSAGSLAGAPGAYGNAEDSGAIQAFNTATGAEIPLELTGRTTQAEGIPEPSALAFNRDGTLLAAGFIYGTVMVWDTRTGRRVHNFSAHSGTIGSIAFHPGGRSFATSGGDATVKFWTTKGRRLLASLNEFDDGEWAAATPDGLFDGSPRGWAQLIWRFSPRALEVAPVEIFFGDFYAPGLLADIFAGRRPPAPSNLAQKDRRQPVLSLVRAEGVVAGRSVALRVNIWDAPAGAQDVRLFRNGSLVKLWHGDVLSGQGGCESAGAGRARCETTVKLVAGENRFTAYAFNRDNIKSEDEVLEVAGAPSLARPGTLYVITVGVNRYANGEFDLRYAVPDAQEFGAELKSQQETLKTFGRTEVVPLYDAEATKENVLRSLRELSDKVEPEDTVVIFFAGHGIALGSRFFMIPHDLGYAGRREEIDAAGLEQIRAHGISDVEMEGALERVSPGRMLLVIDACNSGQAVEAEERRRGPMNSKGLAQLAYEKGMYILAAAQGFQAARGSKNYQHGYLTYALVEEGIRRVKADSEPQDGEVTIREWLDYAVARVPNMQREGEEKREVTHDPARGPARPAAAADDDLQRPRAFYRREREARPLVVARPRR